MSENGEYEITIRIKGKRTNAHFLAKNIEQTCDLAEKYLDLNIQRKTVLVD